MEKSDAVDLINAIDNNIDHFDKSNKFQSLNLSFCQLKLAIEKCVKASEEIHDFAFKYDFDDQTAGNGFRSFLNIFDSAIKKASKVCSRVTKRRENFIFRADKHANDVDEWVKIFTSLSEIFQSLIDLHQNNKSGCLYSHTTTYDNAITRTVKNIDQGAFFGRNIAFQFAGSIRPAIKLIVSSMASYYKFFFNDGPKYLAPFSLPTSFTKYVFSPKKRASKYIHACENSTIEFCSSFWFLAESKLIHTLPIIAAESVDVNKIFKIQPKPIKVSCSSSESFVDVPLPTSHIGIGPVTCRLLCAKKRKGMMGNKSCNSRSLAPSKGLIFHVHGGGFSAQTSKSHEVYLREWAVKLDVPILSIDYSLTPAAPFPRALEEIFYAYCWALNNPELVGSTGENIVFVGDSAGGNLIAACAIKCIEMGIRKPKGLLSIYGTFLVSYSVSPARFLCLIDPFLPYLLTGRMSKSYCQDHGLADINKNIQMSPTDHKNPKQNVKRNRKISYDSLEKELNIKLQTNHLVSPHMAPDNVLAEFPPTKLLSTNLDPFLDDNVEFGKKLKNLKVETTLDVVKGLPHGFLYFGQFSKECHDASMVCVDKIKSLLEL